mmetsp:Transcript_9442/g.18732  ORF Transcript_9442/g.18732 Transcript_9442/m.18732 type:complete len:229 (+) Transcript_9442:56-742(+)
MIPSGRVLYVCEKDRERHSLGGHLLDNGSELLSLGGNQALLAVAGHAGAIGTSEGTGSVGRATVDLVHVEHDRVRVAERHEDHALVSKLGHKGESSGLLATTLSGSGEEDTSGLVGESLLLPKTTEGVEEGLHLGAGHTEAGRDTEEDTIGLGKSLGGGNLVVRLGRGAHLAEHLLGEGFGHLKELGLAAVLLEGSLHRLSHGTDVAVHGVVHNDNGGHLGGGGVWSE